MLLMTLRSASTTVLIIPLILGMLSPQRSRAGTNAAEIDYFSADQKPYGSLSDSSPTGYLLPSLSRIRNSTVPLGFSSITAAASTISPLLLVNFSSKPNLLASHRGICTPQNMSTPWTRKPTRFATDESHDGNRVLLLEIQPRQTYDHPLEPTYDLCTSYSINPPQFQSLDPWAGVQITPEADIYYSRLLLGQEYRLLLGQEYSFSTCYFFGDIDVNHTHIQNVSRTQRTGFSLSLPRKMLLAKDSRTDGNLRHRPRILTHRKHQKILTKAAIATSSALLGLLCSILSLLLWCKRNRREIAEPLQRTELCPSAPRRYSRGELAAATQGLAEGEKIGRGGFGPVYRGYLGDLNRAVAIKVLSQGSSVQGVKEFEAEVKVMTRLRHRNIVELLGWCDGRPRDLLLVYEFVPNGSLDKHLYDPRRVLSWHDRYRIALGAGSAILYLHTECEQCVVHGDIKPANIMLDASCNAKLGDFGLARLVDHEVDPRTTQVVAGTLGYIDPEFVNSRRPSAESDVYSFGVVLLEIACGRRPASTQPNRAAALVNWVREMHRQNSILEAADRRFAGEFDEQQLKRVLVTGLWCAQHDQSQRPSIAQAMDVLRRQDAELPVFGPEIHVADAVRSLEEMAYGNLSGEDSICEESSAETEYHTSKESTCLLAQE